jgi:capsular exopolysaccharide synthesis family protein
MSKPTAAIWELRKVGWVTAVLRHKLLSLSVLIVGLAVTAGYTAALPVLYQSASSVLVENFNRGGVAYQDDSMSYVQEVTKTQRVLAQSRPIVTNAYRRAGESLPQYAATTPGNFAARVDGHLLYLEVMDEKPERAARLANCWAAAFVDEMSLRSRTPNEFMDRSLPDLQRDWIRKQEALNRFERETNFSQQVEQHPVYKRYEELSGRTNALNIELASLQAEQEILRRSAEAPADMLQLPRARADVVLHAYQKQVEEQSGRLLAIGEKYKPDSPEVRAVQESLELARTQLREAVATLANQVEVQTRMVQAEKEHLATLFKDVERQFEDLRAKAAQHKVLSSEAEMAERLYSELAQKKGETDITGRFEYTYVRHWEQAAPALLPSKPNWSRNLVLGLFMSVVAAMCSALLLERLDDTIRTGKDLERRVQVAPFGTVPIFKRSVADEQGYTLAQRQPHSPVVDSLRQIHMSLEVNHGVHHTGQPLVITVSSAQPGEGKSFLTSNLAILFASLGRKVLVVDADFRRGALSRAFNCRGKNSLREAVDSGEWAPSDAFNSATPGYHLLPVGEHAYIRPESLNPEGFERVLEKMKQAFEVILFDTSPVLMVADACVLAKSSELVLLVLRSRRTRVAQVTAAASKLYNAKAKQVHFVVNAVDAIDAAADSYGYYYRYAHDPDQEPPVLAPASVVPARSSGNDVAGSDANASSEPQA